MLNRSLLLFAVLGALAPGCDNAKRSDVEGLQQRLDTIATEQATLRKSVDEAVARETAAATAREQTEVATAAALTDLTTKLATLEARTAVLEAGKLAPPKPVLHGTPDPAERYRVTVDDAFAEGAADAKVTLVIFADFQCPFCARVQPTLAQLQKDYGSDLRIVAKHNPLAFHKEAMPAARAAEAAGEQGKFWEMHDKLYEHQRALGAAEIERYAKDLGLDVSRFRRDMAASTVQDRIDAHVKQAAELGARGTPSFFLNGRYVAGAQPAESFKTLVDAEIAKADELIARGVARSAVYDELMASAKPGIGKTGL